MLSSPRYHLVRDVPEPDLLMMLGPIGLVDPILPLACMLYLARRQFLQGRAVSNSEAILLGKRMKYLLQRRIESAILLVIRFVP